MNYADILIRLTMIDRWNETGLTEQVLDRCIRRGY